MNFRLQIPEVILDAGTFQVPLRDLATTVVLKIEREGPKQIPTPAYVVGDIAVLIRQMMNTYDLLFFVNADERRKKDVTYRPAYSIVTLPLIRCMIDCLYNVTYILTNPGSKGYEFRASGYRKWLESLDDDERQYGGDPKWDNWIAAQRKFTSKLYANDGFGSVEIQTAKSWRTLSAYLRVKKGVQLTPHQEFLKELTYGFWKEYSAMAHGTFEGLLPTASFYLIKEMPHEARAVVENEMLDTAISIHLPRVACLLLCVVTEVQAYFRFDGARINERIHEMWDVLNKVTLVKELFDKRYRELMEDRGIG